MNSALKVALDPVTYAHFTDLSVYNYDNSKTSYSMLVRCAADTTLRLTPGEIVTVRVAGQDANDKGPRGVDCTVVGITPLRGRTGGTLRRAIVQFALL